MTLFEKIKLANLIRKINNEAMWEKLSSRKLWAFVVTATLTALSDQLGIDPENTKGLIALAAAYILGQGGVDAAKEIKKK